MSQLVETGQGLAEFPDEMSHDEIVGVIKKQFYSPENPPPAEIKPGTGAKAENIMAGLDQAPTYPSKADESRGVVENLANAAGELIEGIPGFVAQAPRFAFEGTKLAHGTLSEKLSALSYLGSQAVPMGKQMAADIESPLGSKESFRGFLQAGLMAAPGLELARGVRAGSLQAKLAPITGEVPKLEAPPVQEVPLVEEAKPETLTPQGEAVTQGQAKPLEKSQLSKAKPREETTSLEQAAQNASSPDEFIGAIQKSAFAAEQAGNDLRTDHGLLTKINDWAESTPVNKARFKNSGWFGIATDYFNEAKTKPVPGALQAPVESGFQVKPELPENVEVTIKASTSKGEPLEVKMDAREAEKVLNERKTALENLIDCLGA